LVLCVKNKVDIGRGSPLIYLKIGMIRGEHSAVGKVDLGPYLCEKDDSCLKRGYTSSPAGRMAYGAIPSLGQAVVY